MTNACAHTSGSAHPAAIADRAAGVLLAHAAGDALGVPYEFANPSAGPPAGPDGRAQMLGGGLGDYEPGEWSDDTQMSLCISRVAATGADLTTEAALDDIADAFIDWFNSPPADIGNQTAAVLRAAADVRDRTGRCSASRMRNIAAQVANRTPFSAGNGALMRTESIALAHLHDRTSAARAAVAISELTHDDVLASDSCILAVETIRVAVLTGNLDFYAGLDLIEAPVRRRQWETWLDQAHKNDPSTFNPNGFTVAALQAAIAAIVSTPIPAHNPRAGTFECQHLQHALHAAVRIGNDTDTVAAIAGAFLGAKWGASAVPWDWQRAVHGWPKQMTAVDLSAIAALICGGGAPDSTGWPQVDRVEYHEPRTVAVPHPRDPGVLLGTSNCEAVDVDAVVSLCRVGRDDPDHAAAKHKDRVRVRLIDTEDPAANPNLDFVLADTAAAIDALRAEGRTVLVHCVAAQQRTPAAAIAYSRHLGATAAEAEAEIRKALHASVRGWGHVWDTALG